MKRRSLCLEVLVALLLSIIPVRDVLATSEPPVYASWYVGSNWYSHFSGSSNTPFYNFGYNLPNGAVVILDFGEIYSPSSGTYDFDTWEYGLESFSTVQSQVDRVIQGYDANGSHSATLQFILGTNNYDANYEYNWSAIGADLASLVGSFSSSKVIVDAGDDIEPQWSYPSNVLTLVSAFNSNDSASRWFYDFGWLDGTVNYNGSSPTYPNGWTAQDLNDVAYQDPFNWPYLEVYDSSWATDNADLDFYSNDTQGLVWQDMGVVTENTSGTLSPSQAFWDQYYALDPLVTTIAWNTQIQPVG